MRRTNTHYVTPIKSDGTEAAAASGTDATIVGRGVFTLAAATYFFAIDPTPDATVVHVHLQGDDAVVITSATLEDCDMAESEVTNINDTSGAWLPVPPALIESAAEGAGWIQTSDVLAVAGGAIGGAAWNVANYGGKRMRLKVVATTGGQARLSAWAKE